MHFWETKVSGDVMELMTISIGDSSRIGATENMELIIEVLILHITRPTETFENNEIFRNSTEA